jgi:Tol biopolymer transport system component
MDRHRSAIFEVNADGTNPHALFTASPELLFQAFGDWTPDGNYYVFTSWKDLDSGIPFPAANLWARREKSDLLHRTSASPVNLTAGPIRYFVHTVSLDGKTIFALSSLKHGELMRYDSRRKSFSLYASGLSAEGVSFSRDGAWMAYVKYPQGELWRSRADGSEPLRLSSRPLFAATPSWSPDGKQIAFAGLRAGEAWHSYLVSADGGTPRLISELGEALEPTWSPDGNSLIFGDQSQGDHMIGILNLQTKTISRVPGSRGLFSPRMSPDGRWILALSDRTQKLLLFDRQTQGWKEVVGAKSIAWPQWSADSRQIYFSRVDAESTIMRVGLSGGTPEQIVKLKGLRTTGVEDGWFSLTPGGDVLVLHDTGGGTEIYALSWEAP